MKSLLKVLCIVTLLVIASSVLAPVVTVEAAEHDGPPAPGTENTDLTHGASRRLWYKVARWALRQRPAKK